MKIRTVEKSYEEVLALTPKKHKKPLRTNLFFRVLLKTVSAPDLLSVGFRCNRIGMEKLGRREPCLFLMNHSSFIDLEIAAGLAKYLGKELVIKDMEFASVVTSVQQGLCDIGMAGLSVTPARQEVVTFSDSYYSANQNLVVPGDCTEFDECKTAEDVVKILNKKTKDCKIGCQRGTTGAIYIDGDADEEGGYGFEGLPVTKMEFDYAALAFTAMTNGEVDFVIVDDAPANAIAKAINGK